MESDILCQRDGAIATVTLFNPDKLNALNARMWSRLREAMRELADDDSLRGVILRGEGAAFAAGGDLEEFIGSFHAIVIRLAKQEGCSHVTVSHLARSAVRFTMHAISHDGIRIVQAARWAGMAGRRPLHRAGHRAGSGRSLLYQ